MEITLQLSQAEILQEVAKTTEYTGAKMMGDEGAYERISVMDENLPELKRFWDECRAEVAQAFVRLLSAEGMYDASGNADADGDIYRLRLNVSASFDETLQPSMQLGLFSYFVQGIAARWYIYTNKQEASEYATRAAGLLEEVKQTAFHKKKPTRPVYS